MGARFDYYCCGDMKDEDIAEFHEEMQTERISEYGRGTYAGHIGIAPEGVRQETTRIFDCGEDAESHLQSHCSKWRCARYVRFKSSEGKIRIMVGAWCAN